VIERPYRAILAAQEGAVLRLSLNNPGRKNAIGPVMANDLLWALADAADDASIRSVVLTGAGDAFCAGGDFQQMTSGTDGPTLEPKGDFADLLLAMLRSPKPIVARVNGVAMGGGLGLVAASHFAIAAKGIKLGTPEIDVGLFPMMIMAVLRLHVPRRRLTEMMLLGQKFDADTALALGLVGKVVEPGELDGAVKAITDAIETKSPLAVRLGLEAYAAQEDLDLPAALPLLRERLMGMLGTNDAREGLMAFLERRKPQWTGT